MACEESFIRESPQLAIVVPCLDEEAVLSTTHDVLCRLLETMRSEGLIGDRSSIIYVDDGSRDSTWEMIRQFAEDSRAEGIRLSSNSGHQNALMAGMAQAIGNYDAIVTIDADLQDDPQVMADMVRSYRKGSEIVFGVRSNRESDSWMKRSMAEAYYSLLSRLEIDTIRNHADFRLMSAYAVKALLGFEERNLYLRGIVNGMGFRRDFVYYTRRPRTAGATKYPMRKMAALALDGITSFSVRPVRMVLSIGIVFLIIALAIFIYVMARYFQHATIPGWVSLMISIWFCSGVLLIGLGIVGEYIGKIYMEVKRRPRYIISERTDETSK